MGDGLKHPIVASAAPLSGSVANIKRLEDAGAAARGHVFAVRGAVETRERGASYLMTAGTEFRRVVELLPGSGRLHRWSGQLPGTAAAGVGGSGHPDHR